MSNNNEHDPSSRRIMVQRLASLLGLDDGVSDVFEHLLSIESNEDLLEYMTQLLGDESDSVRKFVDDVGRFKNGEKIISSPEEESVSTSHAPPPSSSTSVSSKSARPVVSDEGAKHRAKIKEREKQKQREQKQTEQEQEQQEQRKRQQDDEERQRKSKEEVENRRKKEENQGKKSTKKQVDRHVQKGQTKKKTVAPTTTPSKATQIEAEDTKTEKSKPPPRGKAKVVCGCFGTHHKPLTNCLHCGRIACRHEGYGFCPFCGYLVEKIVVKTGKNRAFDKALLHKERLLKFDREFARRAIIRDDQADYFSNTSSVWLTEGEQLEAEEMDEMKRREIHSHKKQVLDIKF